MLALPVLSLLVVMLSKDTNNPRHLKNSGIQTKLLISRMGRHILRRSMTINLNNGVVVGTRVTEVVTSLIMLWGLPSALALIGLVVTVLTMAAAVAVVVATAMHILPLIHLHLTRNRFPTVTNPLYL